MHSDPPAEEARTTGDIAGPGPAPSPFRPIRVQGLVEHGEHRGRLLGFPTANLYFADESALPPDGVYGGFARTVLPQDAFLGAAAISVGTNPTFGHQRRRLEAHVLDFDGDLYGQTLEVDIAFQIRAMLTFSGVDELVARIREDVARCSEQAALLTPFSDLDAPMP